jgi:hypothetical protein
MGDGVALGERNIDRVLSGIGYTLFNSIDHVSSFTNANANLPFFIANDHDRTEAELLPTLNYLRNTTDLHNPFLPLRFFFGACAAIAFLAITFAFALFIAVITTIAAATIATATWFGFSILSHSF